MEFYSILFSELYRTTRFGLAFDGQSSLLTPNFTHYLAMDKCGIPPEKLKVNLAELTPAKATGTNQEIMEVFAQVRDEIKEFSNKLVEAHYN